LQRTVGEGGLAGAGLGALIGGAAGGVQGAFAGAEVGRFGGAAAGGYVRQLQEQYATQEQVLDAVTADLRRTNARMDDSIRAMRAAVAERQAAAATQDAGLTERLRAEVDDTVATARQQEAFFATTRSLLISDGLGTQDSIDPELARLRDRVANMQAISDTLAGI
jgi:predicted  nucleic acid-binding Zn-ribbon protein